MTPQEKAVELVNKFEAPYPYQGLSKDYALMAVDEIIAECANWAGGSMDNGWDRKRFDYWQEVKQEIEKL